MRIIAGPCQHESLEESLEIAKHCKMICDIHGIEYYFKASYWKANRTKVDSTRGVGIFDVRHDFIQMKNEIPDLKILTDVHTTNEIKMIYEHVDVLQIPAFLSRQTDHIEAAAETGKIVNIKKGQFMPPWDLVDAYKKAKDASEVWVTERGTTFGHDGLVVDFMGMQYLLDRFGDNFVFDATHSVQKAHQKMLQDQRFHPRDYVQGLVNAAAGMGVESFFLEVHKYPHTAKSDGPNMIKLDNFGIVIRDMMEIRNVVKQRTINYSYES